MNFTECDVTAMLAESRKACKRIWKLGMLGKTINCRCLFLQCFIILLFLTRFSYYSSPTTVLYCPVLVQYVAICNDHT